MELSKQKELFSIAYLQALSAKAGLKSNIDSVDDDSIDIAISTTGFQGLVRNPAIQFQLKCASIARDLIIEDNIHYPLKIKNYNDLRGTDVLSPRYLAVLIVPDDLNDWIVYNSNYILLNHCMYWVSLRSHPESSNTTNVTVKIPVKNKLTCSELRKMIEKAGIGDIYE